MFLYISDLLGVAVFALSGALMAARLRMDPFGVVVLAAVTAIGGGTLRDIILDIHPVFWVDDPAYIWAILATAALAMLFVNKLHHIPERSLLIADAAGLALFAVAGTERSLVHGAPALIAIMMGVMTGVTGGLLRDVLCRQIPMVLQKEVYATACIIGCTLYVVMDMLSWHTVTAMTLSMLACFAVRVSAIHWHLQLPAFQLQQQQRK